MGSFELSVRSQCLHYHLSWLSTRDAAPPSTTRNSGLSLRFLSEQAIIDPLLCLWIAYDISYSSVGE